MTQFLVRRLIGREQPPSTAARAFCGKAAGLIGIVCNLILFLAKLLIGTISGSVSITADALNNLTDASSSVVTLVGFKIAEKPADEGHPFGHARMEYISGLIVAGLIVVIGVELGRSSFNKILHPEPVEFSAALVLVLLGSIVVKLWLSRFNRALGNAIESETLLATAADSRNDVISTAAVLAACLIGRFSGLMIDGWMGLAVAVFILLSGIATARDTINPLLGSAPDPKLMREIAGEITAYDKVLGLHDLVLHDYGPGRRFGSVHVEMDCREDPLLCHNIIDDIERHFKQQHGVDLVIHYDPIVTGDEELDHMRCFVQDICSGIDSRLSVHDFRMVRGPSHTNLIFDLVVPFDLQSKTAELQAVINEHLQEESHKYYTVITFDDDIFHISADTPTT